MQQQNAAEAETDFEPVFRVRVEIDVYVQGRSEQAVRAQIAEMDVAEIAEQADTGAFVAGTKMIGAVTLVPDDQLDGEMASIGSDASFFRM